MTEESDRLRLATKRVNNAIKTIQLVGNLSNRSNYQYTVERIFNALQSELKACRDRFAPGSKQKSGFSLE